MKIAIIEDEKEFSNLLKNHINQYAEETGFIVETIVFDNPIVFLERCNCNDFYDAIFLDINMPQMNGMDVAHKIRQNHKYTIIAFVTNMPQYAIQGYSVNAFDFIVKPISYKSFKLHFDRIVEHYNFQDSNMINVKIGRVHRQFKISDIYYIEMINHTAVWYTKNGNFQGTDKSLSEIEKMLPKHYFCKCSKAFLVNFQHISSIKNDLIKIKDFNIKITRTYKTDFLSAFSGFLSKQGGE